MRPRIFQILNSKKIINSTHPTFWTSASCFCCNLSFSSWYLASISFVFMSNFKENILKVLLIYFSIWQKYTIKLNSCMKDSIIFHVHLIVTSPAITLHTLIHWVYSVITSKLIKSLLNKPHSTGWRTQIHQWYSAHSTPPKGSLWTGILLNPLGIVWHRPGGSPTFLPLSFLGAPLTPPPLGWLGGWWGRGGADNCDGHVFSEVAFPPPSLSEGWVTKTSGGDTGAVSCGRRGCPPAGCPTTWQSRTLPMRPALP